MPPCPVEDGHVGVQDRVDAEPRRPLVQQAVGITDPPSFRCEVQDAFRAIRIAGIDPQAPTGDDGTESTDVAGGEQVRALFEALWDERRGRRHHVVAQRRGAEQVAPEKGDRRRVTGVTPDARLLVRTRANGADVIARMARSCAETWARRLTYRGNIYTAPGECGVRPRN